MVTKFTEHYSLVLGIVILMFALGLRKGLLGFVVDWWAGRKSRSLVSQGQVLTGDAPVRTGKD